MSLRHYEKDGAYYVGGAFVKFLHIVRSLFDEVEVCVPVFKDPPAHLVRVDVPGVTVVPLPRYFERWEAAALLHPLRLGRRLWPVVARADVAWVIVPNYVGLIGWILCLLQGKRFILSVAGDWPEMYRLAFARRGLGPLGRIVGGVHRLILFAMIRTSAVAFMTGSSLTEEYGQSNGRVVGFFNTTVSERHISRTVASSGSDEPCILFVGRLDRYKGVYELIRAARLLRDEGLAFRVRLAGEGNRREDLEALARDLGVSDRVEFLGRLRWGDELSAAYRGADVFTLPSYSEGAPKVVLEAMAAGLPVVATNVGGIPRYVKHGCCGYLVPPRDAESLAGALRTLLEDEAVRRRMGKESLRRVRSFTLEAEQALIADALGRSGLLNTCRQGGRRTERQNGREAPAERAAGEVRPAEGGA